MSKKIYIVYIIYLIIYKNININVNVINKINI